MTGPDPEDALATLRRWEDSGGTWELVHDDGATLVIDLLTCTGDEVMATLRSDEPGLQAYVGQAELGTTRRGQS
jgi:hypothetical protein